METKNVNKTTNNSVKKITEGVDYSNVHLFMPGVAGKPISGLKKFRAIKNKEYNTVAPDPQSVKGHLVLMTKKGAF